MLTEKQRIAILTDENFGAIEEMLAVAALKRRLDFLGRASKQTHECPEFSVDVERAGRALRIKWRFKQRHDSGFDLLGFRRTGGFFNDAWDEENNGALVIHADQNNEIIEFLEVGQTNFYTLFMKWPGSEGKMVKSSAVRFQVTIAPEKEMEAIEAALEKAERKKMEPRAKDISELIEELSRVIEFKDVIDSFEKSAIDKIRNKNLPAEEEEEQIEFVRDAVRLQREKIQL